MSLSKLFSTFITLLGPCVVVSQSLADATGAFPQLSDFTQLLTTDPNAAAAFVTNFTSDSIRQTILVPSNDAFTNYEKTMGIGFSDLSSSDMSDQLNYHTLQGALSSSDLQTPGGLVASTALTSEPYDNRELSSDGATQPQVVYIASTDTSDGARIKARQDGPLGNVDAKSGEGMQITLENTRGNWSGGYFYIVDGFLTLPVNQTVTMTAQNLTAFVLGLNRTNVTDGTNAARGLTCTCPINKAFDSIATSTGNLSDGPASLLATLTRHGLTGSYYSTNFTDGDLIESQNGYPILVTRRGGAVYLNDAKIVDSNNIANTGAVHALDRIMGYLNTTTNVTTPANATIYSNTSNIPSPTPPVTTSSSGGAIPTDSLIASGTGTFGLGANGSVPTASVTGDGFRNASATGIGGGAVFTGDSDRVVVASGVLGLVLVAVILVA